MSSRGAFGGLEPRDALFHGERALVQLVRAHERPQMQIVRRLLQMGDLLLVFLILPAQLLIPALLFPRHRTYSCRYKTPPCR